MKRPDRLLRTLALIAGGVLVSVFFGLLAFGDFRHQPDGWHFVPRIKPDDLRSAFAQVSWTTVGLVTLLTMASLPIRAAQWGQLVFPRGSFRDRYHSTAIGFMAINTLPLSLGEVTRGLMLSYRVPGLPKSTSVGSVLAGRMFDIFALWLLAAPLPFVLVVAPSANAFVKGGMIGLTTLGWGAMLLVWIAQRQGERLSRLLTKVLGKRLGELLSHFLAGFGVKLSAGSFLKALGLSIVFQAVTASAYIPIIHAISPQVSPISAAVFGLSAISVGLAVPSTPSGVGVFHFAMGTAMQAVGATPAQAVAIAILLHLGALSGFILAGVLSLMVTGASAFRSSLSEGAT